MTDKKIKILTISDHPLSPSGVGSQTKYMIEALLKTGKFQVFSLAGAIKHENYELTKIEPYGEDWLIQPVDGYGNQEAIRSIIRTHKPDMLWFMTDPRFWEWLWAMDNEIRPLIPMVYYHVWDNYPAPKYNKKFYDSNDFIACISKVTHDIVKKTTSDVETMYIPHAVDSSIFTILDDEEKRDELREKYFGTNDKFVIMWNNRNAKRKQTGTLINWYGSFLKQLDEERAKKCVLLLHTDPNDPYGQDVNVILRDFGLDKGQVLISKDKVPPQNLAAMYNIADIVVNISDAEGFGLATLESLSCGTPIVVTMTGGLQEQVTDGEDWFGVGIEPCSKSLIGSQQVPYIYEDRISETDFINALNKMLDMSREERKEIGLKGREHVLNNYNFENFEKTWVDVMTRIHEESGSWENRKGYKPWDITEIE
jgi:glycosyltransferase involved in cell wall biosynthesis